MTTRTYTILQFRGQRLSAARCPLARRLAAAAAAVAAAAVSASPLRRRAARRACGCVVCDRHPSGRERQTQAIMKSGESLRCVPRHAPPSSGEAPSHHRFHCVRRPAPNPSQVVFQLFGMLFHCRLAVRLHATLPTRCACTGILSAQLGPVSPAPPPLAVSHRSAARSGREGARTEGPLALPLLPLSARASARTRRVLAVLCVVRTVANKSAPPRTAPLGQQRARCRGD